MSSDLSNDHPATLPAYRQGTELNARLQELLAAAGKISTDAAADLCGSPAQDQELLNHGKLDETTLLAFYAEASGIPLLDEKDQRDINAWPEVTFDFLNTEGCLPLSWNAEKAVLAIASPYNAGRLEMLWRNFYEVETEFVLVRRAFIERHLTSLYDHPDHDATSGNWDGSSEQALRDLAREAPIVRLVNDIFAQAQETGSSDIHVEPGEDDVAVRFRIDGLLQTVMRPPKVQYPAIASRIKLLAGMNIAELSPAPGWPD